MKKSALLGVVVAVLVIGVVGCSKKSAEKKIVTPDDVAKSLSTVLCEKYMGCQQPESQPLNKEQCLQNITTGIADRVKGKAELKVEQGMVDKCVKAITGAGCDVLSSDAPPAGCEFLQ